MMTTRQEENTSKEMIPRRKFIKTLWIALISISVLEVTSVIIAFLTSGSKKRHESKTAKLRVLARVEDVANGSVTAFRSNRLYLVRMDDGGLLALSLQCTHLGCAITWNKDKDQFDCPCHASSFNMKGEVLSPPAPRTLDTYPIRIEGGMIKADLSIVTKRNSFNKSQLVYA